VSPFSPPDPWENYQCPPFPLLGIPTFTLVNDPVILLRIDSIGDKCSCARACHENADPLLCLESVIEFFSKRVPIIIPTNNKIRHPPPELNDLPILRCLPLLVVGIPVNRAILFLAAEMPKALFKENENPYVRRLLIAVLPKG